MKGLVRKNATGKLVKQKINIAIPFRKMYETNRDTYYLFNLQIISKS